MNVASICRTANRDQLIHSIVKPSDAIAPQFQGWEIRKQSGEIVTGRQGHLRTGGTASIMLLDGTEARVPAAEIASFGAMPASLMPEGLPALLSIEEFRDLVAFLASLK